MKTSGFERLACPLDGLPLLRHPTAWRCKGGHGFDIARQGYAHLLPVQHKRSLEPGDSKAMVAARARFLEAGFYGPIAAALSALTLRRNAAARALSCLDAGCGEGYYLRQLAAAAESEPSPARLELLGLDISKWAVLAASKRDTRVTWVVASNARLPILSGTLDVVICAFGFPAYREFGRVLKPGGRLLRVDPGGDHLRELREVIYSGSRRHPPPEPQAPPDFRLADRLPLQNRIHLTAPQQIQDLLMMTPHGYRLDAAGRARAEALSQLTLTTDVTLTTFERTAEGSTARCSTRRADAACDDGV